MWNATDCKLSSFGGYCYLSLMKLPVIIIGIMLLVSCAKEEKQLSDFQLIQNRIINTSCAFSGCHQSSTDPSFAEHGLILEQSVAYQNLINRNPKNTNALADKLLLVKPFKAEESLLYHKLHFSDHHSGDYGTLMPLGLDPLFQGQVEFIRRWIEAGAKSEGNAVDAELLNDTTPMEEEFEALAPPPVGKGIQIGLPEFDVAPNFEREFFVYKKIGNTEGIYVNRFEIKMRKDSHHFILYDFNSSLPPQLKPSLNVIRDIRNANGSSILQNMLAMPYHVYLAGTQTPYSDFTFPEGVAMYIPAGAAVDLNSHYVNKRSTPIKGEVSMNLYTVPYTSGLKIAKPLNLGNRLLYLPPQQRTVAKETFLFSNDVSIVALTSHTHQLGEKFIIKIKGGARDGQIVYTSTDWHHPETTYYNPPIVLKIGEGLTSEITYNNTKTVPVYFGLTSEDEMGIIFGYYYEN